MILFFIFIIQAGMSTIRPGLKMFVIPTGEYTHKIGKPVRFPLMLSLLFLQLPVALRSLGIFPVTETFEVPS